MIELDVRTIALVGSSLFAAIGLLLNFSVTRRNNRIAVSSKLSELSKLLSDELVARVEMHSLLTNELEEAKAYPDQAVAAEKVRSLEESLRRNIKRQNDLDSETKYLEEAFLNLDKVDIGGLDAKIAQSYRTQRVAESTLSFSEKRKLQRDP